MTIPPTTREHEIALVVSGASGAALAPRFATRALESGQVAKLHVVLTDAARLVLGHELGADWGSLAGFKSMLNLNDDLKSRVQMWPEANLMAPVSSGSHRLSGTVVLPCSAGMASAIANGISRGLGQRVADVALKQRWPLIVGIRETPMSPILLQNLLTLARAGAFIVPPLPAFYIADSSTDPFEVFIDHYAMRVLDLLGIDTTGQGLRWRD